MSLKDDFESAVTRSKELPEKPSNEILLNLYSLYKQATDGDVSGEKPGLFDDVVKRPVSGPASYRGDYAVGAVIVASLHD